MSQVQERFTMKASDFEIVIAKHGTHDQSSHGNWANGGIGAGVAQSVLDRVAENGGLSVKLVDGSEPTGGYMVAKGSQYGSVASAADFYDATKGPKILADYLKTHKKTLGNANNYLGLWHNKDDGNVYLDVSENIQDKGRAISAGAKRDQISIWDVANFAEIPTGGTGSVEKDGSSRDSSEYLRDDGRGNRSVRSEDLGQVGQAKVIRFAPGLKPILKHLEGQHDQASHGSWASGRWQVAQNIKNEMATGDLMSGQALVDFLNSDQIDIPWDDINKLSKAMFEISHEGGSRTKEGKIVNLTSVVETAGPNSNGDLEIVGEIQDSQGYHVGEFGRTIAIDEATGDLTMTNDILSLDSEYTGTGFGTAFLDHAENYAYALGIKNQYVHAVALSDPASAGPFVWAKRGYGWDTQGSAASRIVSHDNVLYHINRVLSQNNPDPYTETALYDIQSRMMKYSDSNPNYPTPHEIAYTGWKPGASTWAGMDVMGNADWFGVKPVGPSNAESLPNGGRLSP